MEHELNVGDAIISMCGRNEGMIYIVLKSEGDYVYLANGIDRYVDKPKKKRKKHCRIISYGAVCNKTLNQGDVNATLYQVVMSIKSSKETVCQRKI